MRERCAGRTGGAGPAHFGSNQPSLPGSALHSRMFKNKRTPATVLKTEPCWGPNLLLLRAGPQRVLQILFGGQRCEGTAYSFQREKGTPEPTSQNPTWNKGTCLDAEVRLHTLSPPRACLLTSLCFFHHYV